MKVPQGFENYYAADVLLLLLKAIYGNKQAEMTFWKEILKCIMHMKYMLIRNLKDNRGGRRLLRPPNPHQSQVPPTA